MVERIEGAVLVGIGLFIVWNSPNLSVGLIGLICAGFGFAKLGDAIFR